MNKKNSTLHHFDYMHTHVDFFKNTDVEVHFLGHG